MTDMQRREAARQFYYKWNGKGREDEDARSYWIDILQDILGVEHVTDRVDFEKKVIGADGNTKRIDVYIPETHVLIEQKSLGISLDRPQTGHENMTPYEQAKMYDNGLPFDEKARWIVTSNFAEIWIYDMNQRRPEPIKIDLVDLQSKYHMLDFLVNQETKKITDEMDISIKAGEVVGLLYDAFLKQYQNPDNPKTLKSLNKLCVRIVFCLYAEDAGIFGRHLMFHDYMERFPVRDMRKALVNLFRILNQKPEDRDRYLADDDPLLAAFPYVNGGLFSEEDIEIPPFTEEIRDLILNKASADFDWSQISPTIFGAVFESTLNPETRRSGGMHYTSIDNIHKVIDPLFLDELKTELGKVMQINVLTTRTDALNAFQDKLASTVILDPACGSGNFLTESYISIRRLENEVIAAILDSRTATTKDKREQITMGQIALGIGSINPIRVSISQFYGIEINDFAVTVAQTALWIAENQMMKETEDIVHMTLDFLPLKTNANIVEGNALKIDWSTVVSPDNLSYIIGNPPFIGASLMSADQKTEAVAIFGDINLSNSIDYVGAWYFKAAELIQQHDIHVALVSTNSITQGEQVEPLWRTLFDKYHLTIEFAYRTFRWDSEASIKAHVHCVIIGFTCQRPRDVRTIYDGTNKTVCKNISAYLIDADNIFVSSRSKPLWPVPKLTKGNQPTDDGNFILSEEERDAILRDNPEVEDLIKPYIGAHDFLNQDTVRYCLWLKDVNPGRYIGCKEIMRRIQAVREFRLKSSAAPTRKAADRAYQFFSTPQTNDSYIIIPRHSSERRRYIPMAIYGNDKIASDACSIIPGGNLYHFGVLESNVHMAWMRTVCGRLEMRYRYSGGVVYNNFPWPEPSEEQRIAIENTAKGILDARNIYPECTLAQLYGENMNVFSELMQAHKHNDIAVMKAYGMPIRETDELSCVTWLMRLYKDKTSINN